MRAGQWKIVQLLAEHGAQVTIHQAACLGQLEKVKQLLAAGVEIDARDPQGWTALRWAAQEGHADVVRLLLAHGADVNGKSDDGEALSDAIRRGHNDVAVLLMVNGANLDGGSHAYGNTPLELAVSSGMTDLAKLLISKGALGKMNSDCVIHAMLDAAWGGHGDIVELFLANGLKVNAEDGSKWTALQCAAGGGHEDVVQLLVAKGAAVNAADNRGRTAVTRALEQDNREIVRLLAANGADLTLHAASYIGDANAVQRLLSRGADIDATDEDKRTPLYLAAREGHTAVLELLIARGAEIDRGEKDSWLPTPLYVAVEHGQTGMVKLLIRHGANIHAKNLVAHTPLHVAALHGRREIAGLLIDNGVEIDARAEWDSTALREAALHGHGDVVELLLTRGAEIVAGEMDVGITLPSPRGRTAAETARLLIEAYAPFTIIVTDAHEVRSFLTGLVSFDDLWIPDQVDIQGLDVAVRTALETNSSVIASSWLDRDYVLRNFRRYDRAYAGFIDDGTKYLICNMTLSDSFHPAPIHATFPIVFDGGSNAVRVIFKAADKSVTKIECNGNG